MAGLHILPVGGIGEIRPGAALGPLSPTRAATRTHRCSPATVSSSPRRSCRRRRAGSSRSTTPTSRPGPTLIASETVRVLRRRDELVITETRHGFVCANAGVDLSNVDDGYAALLPVDGDSRPTGSAT